MAAGMSAAASGAGASVATALPTASSFALMELGGAGAGAASGGGGLGSMFSLLGTGVSAAGQIAAGQNAQAMANAEAAELKRRAAEERAAAQREAMEKRKKANLLLSRSQAVSAASGAGATDPTVLAVEGGIAKEGEYQADVENYLGESRARGLIHKAAMTQAEGADAKQASLFRAGGTILSGISPYFQRYGGMGRASQLHYGGFG